MSISNYLEQKIVEHVLQNTTYTPPATVYLALCENTNNMETNGAITELSGNGYSRQAVTFGNISAGITTNTNTITFSQATGDWAKVTAAAIMDDVTGGNVLIWGTTSAKTFVSGDTPSIAPSKINFSID